MNRYFKVNRLVAEHLGLTSKRNMTADGNYLLWQADILKFGEFWQQASILKRIGGVALTGRQAKMESDGLLSIGLPTATDPKFVIPGGSSSSEEEDIVDSSSSASPSQNSDEGNASEESASSEEESSSDSESDSESVALDSDESAENVESNTEEETL